MDIIKVVLFILGNGVIFYYSLPSLPKPRSHGFYRFFAWEFILALVMVNFDVWFRDPFSITQIMSWILLIIAIYLVIHGVMLLRMLGKPRAESQRGEVPVMHFEKTTSLVMVGAYRYIRHPLYSSLLFLAWGVFFKDPTYLGATLAAAASLALLLTAGKEEDENIRFFGPEYEAYIQKTKMFIPFIF